MRLLPIIAAAGLAFWPGLVLGQMPDMTSAPSVGRVGGPVVGGTSTTPWLATMPPAADGTAERAAGSLRRRAVFDAGMLGIDSSIVRLGPAINRTVAELVRLARRPPPESLALRRRVARDLDSHGRAIAVEERQLAAVERALGRWRARLALSPGADAAMTADVLRRTNRAAALHRWIGCGHRYVRFARQRLVPEATGSRAPQPLRPPAC